VVIALIGADGQLGTDLAARIPKDSLRPLFYPSFDVTDGEAASSTLRSLKPDVVINTAAFHRVDECEDRVEEAFRVNAFAVRGLAGTCREIGAVLVHFSTDYVFDGEKRRPYLETDIPRPLNAYAESKLAGEHFIQSAGGRFFIIRTCGLYGRAGCLEKSGRNFVQTMLALAAEHRPIRVVDDQTATPTSTQELADNVLALIRTRDYGLYHMTNEGHCSWYDFARAVFEIARVKADLAPVSSAQYPVKARRPSYSVLENKMAKDRGLPGFSPWRDALKNYLDDR